MYSLSSDNKIKQNLPNEEEEEEEEEELEDVVSRLFRRILPEEAEAEMHPVLIIGNVFNVHKCNNEELDELEVSECMVKVICHMPHWFMCVSGGSFNTSEGIITTGREGGRGC